MAEPHLFFATPPRKTSTINSVTIRRRGEHAIALSFIKTYRPAAKVN